MSLIEVNQYFISALNCPLRLQYIIFRSLKAYRTIGNALNWTMIIILLAKYEIMVILSSLYSIGTWD
jgi:hypothetical protein